MPDYTLCTRRIANEAWCFLSQDRRCSVWLRTLFAHVEDYSTWLLLSRLRVAAVPGYELAELNVIERFHGSRVACSHRRD